MIQDIIKQLRLQHKMTQSKFAEALNLSQSTVASYEHGDRKPSYEVLCQIADYFNVSTDYLLGRVNLPYINTIDLSSNESVSVFTQKKDLLPDEEKQIAEQINRAKKAPDFDVDLSGSNFNLDEIGTIAQLKQIVEQLVDQHLDERNNFDH